MGIKSVTLIQNCYEYKQISAMVKLAFNKVTLTGFTNEEAAKFIDEKRKSVNIKIKYLRLVGQIPVYCHYVRAVLILPIIHTVQILKSKSFWKTI